MNEKKTNIHAEFPEGEGAKIDVVVVVCGVCGVAKMLGCVCV